ncbi:hypothetical protein [Arthrobacter bussei]|nr:hypothetical protein [Arthrobacter bussei]
MSATRCTCVWGARPLVRLVMDPACPAFTLHVLRDTVRPFGERPADG